MRGIKRRDRRQNNGTSFNKAEYGIGRPVGFNQVPWSSSLLLLEAFTHSSYVHTQVVELNPRTTGDDKLLLLSRLLLSSAVVDVDGTGDGPPIRIVASTGERQNWTARFVWIRSNHDSTIYHRFIPRESKESYFPLRRDVSFFPRLWSDALGK